MKICKSCGEINQADTKYCANCGRDAFVFSVDFNCPHCGIANDKRNTHCTNCGNAISYSANAKSRVVEPASVVAATDVSTAVDLRSYEVNQYAGDSSLVEISHNKETAKCPKCGNELQINSIFCYKCGEPVARIHEHKIVKRKVCIQCGTPNLTENPYCSYCYQSLSDSPTEDFQIVHKTVQLSSTVVKQAQLHGNAGNYHICNNCGALTKESSDFCVSCGLKLVIEEQKRYCVNCGAENANDAQFCSKCQWSFEGEKPGNTKPAWKCANCDNINEHDNQFCIKCGHKKPVH